MHCEALLLHENDNSHDPNAILVTIRGKSVGHLSRENALVYRAMMAAMGVAGRPAVCAAYISGGWSDPGGGGFFGVKLGLEWPPEIDQSAP